MLGQPVELRGVRQPLPDELTGPCHLAERLAVRGAVAVQEHLEEARVGERERDVLRTARP